MKSWLAANWKHVIGVVLLIATVSGWVSRAHWLGVAEAEAATAARQQVTLDEQRAELAAQGLRLTEAARVLAEANERAEEAVAGLEEARSRSEELGDSLDSVIRAQADSTGGWIRVEDHDAVVVQKDAQIAAADSASAIWQGRFTAVQAHSDSLTVAIMDRDTQIGRYEVQLETKDRQIDALENAVAPSFRVRLLDNWELVALGVVLGVVGWEVAR